MQICHDRQRLLDENGHGLVTGGPGAGKTTIALKKAVVRIEEGLDLGQSILFLSFSRAAVNRVVESAAEWVPEEHMKRISVQTFHSFFWSIIKTYSYLLGAPKNLSILLPHDEKALNKGIKPKSEDWGAWLTERERLFYEEGRIAFDLFSPTALKLLTSCQEIKNIIAKRYPLIIIDEAQDTDEEQWSSTRALSSESQLICLADLEQQIYDFREGVSAERVAEILEQLHPLRIDLGGQNNRSPDSEILQCGNDILLASPKDTSYRGVSRLNFRRNKEDRDKAIRSSVGIIYRTIAEAIGEPPENIAILTSTNNGVTTVVNALRGTEDQKAIPHRILFDETKALLSSRLVAFLMEPKSKEDRSIEKAIFFELMAAVFHSKGTQSGQDKADRWVSYADLLRKNGNCRNVAFVKVVDSILDQLETHKYEGNPRKDWMFVRRLLRNSGNRDLKEIDTAVEYLMAFNRGKAISSGMSANWQNFGCYSSARNVVDAALAQDQLMSDDNDCSGIHVMTMHKSKGKQFDGVILVHESNICSFTTYGDVAPYRKSRKLLRVAVTRAKKHACFLTDAFNPPELLEGFHF